ncbi:MAG: hypothetical protein IKP19_09130 [Oscillospiraceae bacterium]|nr:hypothetical protein [Oscillospiraceae bacterium]
MSASASKKKRKELETQGLSPKEIRAKKETDKRKKTTRNIILAVVAVLLVAAIVVGIIALLNHRYRQTVATVGDQKITVPVYNCFYANNANQMYSYLSQFNAVQPNVKFSEQANPYGEGTLEDYLVEYTNSYLQSVYILYSKAQNDSNFQLSQDGKDSIAQALQTMKDDAAARGYPDADKFLSQAYGRGTTLEDYETYLNITTVAAEYDTYLQSTFAPTEEELKSAYEAAPDDYDIVAFSYSDTKAVGKVDKENEDKEVEITDEDRAEAKKNAEAKEKEFPADATETHVRKSNVSSNKEMADWLFDAACKEGDIKTFQLDEEGNNYRTIKFGSRDTNDYARVTAYVIEIPKDKAPEAVQPETATPDAEAPDAETPETEAPETEAPETVAPETEAPETEAPETEAPETEAPETEAPETEAPETEAPETEAPETVAPADDEKKDDEKTPTAEETLAKIVDGLKPEMTDAEFEEYVKAQYKAVSTEVLDKNDLPEEVNEYLFSADRKAGDYETITTEDTYYVVRYVSTNEMTYRNEIVKNSLYNAMYSELMASVTIDVDKKALKYANTDLAFYANSAN